MEGTLNYNQIKNILIEILTEVALVHSEDPIGHMAKLLEEKSKAPRTNDQNKQHLNENKVIRSTLYFNAIFDKNPIQEALNETLISKPENPLSYLAEILERSCVIHLCKI